MQETTSQSAAPKPSTDSISFAGKVKLLDMSFARVRFGIMMTPLVAVSLVWVYSFEGSPAMLLAWTLLYCLAALAMPWLYRRHYQADRQSLSDQAVFTRWKPRLHALALAHGLGLALPVFFTPRGASFEFCILLVLAIATAVTLNSSYQTPILGMFLRFFAACWGAVTVCTYWLFPLHWQIMLPFAIAYAVTIYRHALKAHGFFVTQIFLEEQAADSAAQFRSAKNDAERALQEKNLFLSTASHDLRQPVFAIGMLTEAIASQIADPKVTHLLDDLRSSVQSLNLMFNSLLDLSRIEAGQAPASQANIHLAPLLQEVMAIFEETARAAGLQLRLCLPPGPVAVVADPDLLRQALVNLTHNALRYTRRGGVLIGVRRRGAMWQLEVWDTGIGIAEGEHGKIYSPYYRNEDAWRADATGHGLGLHVVARCAKLMGAQYGLTSSLGRGSRFWLRLAQADPGAVPAQAMTRAMGETPHAPVGGKCLVVEDDPQVVDAWAALLAAWRVEARFAATSQEALAALRGGFDPAVVLCDQRLRSGESGFAILRDLLGRLPHARGAMVSGEHASPELAQAEEEGYLVFRKPVNIDQLHGVLSGWRAA